MEGIMNQTLYDYPTLGSHSASYNTTLHNSTASFQPSLSPMMDKILSAITIIILLFTMVSLGCTMEILKIKAHIVRPKGVAIALVAQYGIMPLAAFSLAKLFQLGPIESVTVLICGCSPGGNLSNILALAAQGDMNLSIVMTTCSTILALGMMPLLLYLYCQSIPNLKSSVPYTGIILALVMTLVPCAIGIAINHRAPRYSPIITKVGMCILLIGSVTLVILSGITIGGTILTILSPQIMATASLLPLSGYLFGYLLSSIFSLNGQCRRTIAMETGCQNVQLCATILKVAFPPEVIGPLFLFPLIFILFQVMEALVFVILFRCHQRFRTPVEEKGVYMAVGSTVEVRVL
ncbi:sodium/bile acid cotransporter-like [Megalops cyprinoides]|uniref:sodium/bile acid cotransporter-like n=1 Tax=Megalops cyprinoides TaxID=118141 RepID=UPI001863D2AF|nr:sodium/bile acid cotransporter-like [Megalops cyprinoides]